jgi:hypothetical protein
MFKLSIQRRDHRLPPLRSHQPCPPTVLHATQSRTALRAPHSVQALAAFGRGSQVRAMERVHTLCVLSCSKKTSRSAWLQFRPIGEILSMPLRNSMNVPVHAEKKIQTRLC